LIPCCKEPENYWCVAFRTKLGDRTQIMCICEEDLLPYKRHCWFCGEEGLNSDVHLTCPRCGWIKCPECGECKKDECDSNQLIVYPNPGSRKLPNGYNQTPEMSEEVYRKLEDIYNKFTL
jgi:hypothetical protein